MRAALQTEPRRPRLPPLFDLPALDGWADLKPPRFARGILLEPTAASRLSDLQEPLAHALSTYSGRLLAWADASIQELGRDAMASAGPTSELPPELAHLAQLAASIDAGQGTAHEAAANEGVGRT